MKEKNQLDNFFIQTYMNKKSEFRANLGRHPNCPHIFHLNDLKIILVLKSPLKCTKHQL